MKKEKTRFAVLVSGNGTNLQALLDAIKSNHLDAEIALVVSSDPGAPAIGRAAASGVPTEVLVPPGRSPGANPREAREQYDAALADIVARSHPDFIFMLGWMRILTNVFISKFPGKILNLHPAMPGAFPGIGAIAKAWAAWHREEIEETGVMIHFVDDERVDSGPVLLTQSVKVKGSDTLADFDARMHEMEHTLVVKAAKTLCARARDFHGTGGGA